MPVSGIISKKPDEQAQEKPKSFILDPKLIHFLHFGYNNNFQKFKKSLYPLF